MQTGGANLLEQIFMKIQIRMADSFYFCRNREQFWEPKSRRGFLLPGQEGHQRQTFLTSKFHFGLVPFFFYFSYPDVQEIQDSRAGKRRD